ncbi:hypothetical protein FO519_001469 [Halicephalobus sp. NKZ332]|nr:hypothetical protein FO519_001469 [Halicephalobus sp. NKZ332]
MADILKLSKREGDLLREAEPTPEVFKKTDNLHSAQPICEGKVLEAPKAKPVMSTHELQADLSRMKRSINQFVEEKRMLGGNGMAEHMINELYAASQINRGPQGAFPSSRLHLDMLLGRNERITPADYLNFDYNFA